MNSPEQKYCALWIWRCNHYEPVRIPNENLMLSEMILNLEWRFECWIMMSICTLHPDLYLTSRSRNVSVTYLFIFIQPSYLERKHACLRFPPGANFIPKKWGSFFYPVLNFLFDFGTTNLSSSIKPLNDNNNNKAHVWRYDETLSESHSSRPHLRLM